MSISFKNPPIDEVIVSTYFDQPLSGFRSEHIGLFWSKIKDNFPVVRQNPMVGTGIDLSNIGTLDDNSETLPMPRYWFIAGDEIDLIQIQKNALMFNWRRRDKPYPHFHDVIKPAFDRYYGLFGKFIQDEVQIEEPAIDLCELTYINVLQGCDYWGGPQDTMNVFPSFSILTPDIATFKLQNINCNYGYEVETNLHLNINVRNGRMTKQKDIPVLAFEIKAHGRLGHATKPVADEWFERAHSSILECFARVISGNIQKEHWGVTEGQ